MDIQEFSQKVGDFFPQAAPPAKSKALFHVEDFQDLALQQMYSYKEVDFSAQFKLIPSNMVHANEYKEVFSGSEQLVFPSTELSFAITQNKKERELAAKRLIATMEMKIASSAKMYEYNVVEKLAMVGDASVNIKGITDDSYYRDETSDIKNQPANFGVKKAASGVFKNASTTGQAVEKDLMDLIDLTRRGGKYEMPVTLLVPSGMRTILMTKRFAGTAVRVFDSFGGVDIIEMPYLTSEIIAIQLDRVNQQLIFPMGLTSDEPYTVKGSTYAINYFARLCGVCVLNAEPMAKLTGVA